MQNLNNFYKSYYKNNGSVAFVSFKHDLNRASYRLFINDLNYYLKEIGVNSNITDDVLLYDYIIIDKFAISMYETLKEKYPNKKIGIVNLNINSDKKPDFIITGSILEKYSMVSCNYKNVLVFPLIEQKFINLGRKIHKNKNNLVICYHGNEQHLNRFSEGLSNALDILSKTCNIELNIISGSFGNNTILKNGFPDVWIDGKPNIKINFFNYDLNTIANIILEADIGIVPNISNIDINEYSVDYDIGLYDTDYNIRFKNKSNSGRCFVFHQLGIPVICDITPTNFHILGNPECGFIVHGKEGWLDAFNQLKDFKLRQFIADNAVNEFYRLYNPFKWAKNLYEQLINI